MGKPDAVTKEYVSRSDIFADIFNHFLYGGKQKFIKYSGDKDKLQKILNSDKSFKAVSRDTANVINAVTKSGFKIDKNEEVVDMCKAMMDIKEEGREEGREESILSSIKKMMSNLKLSAEQAMDALEIAPADRQHYLSML